MIVQIYEIQTPQEAEKCIEVGVDHIGSVILSKKDWKLPNLRVSIRVSNGTSVKNSIIPLFHDVDSISRALDYYEPDFVHLCESLTDNQGALKDIERYIKAQGKIRERFPGIGIIRSIPIPRDVTLSKFPTLQIAHELEPVSDIFLTDTWLEKEPVDGFIGITGKVCDRKLAKDLVTQSVIPIILGGGLSAENVYEALIDVCPAGADSCTMTNMLDKNGKPIRFQKDFAKVEIFVKETRRAEEMLLDKKGQLRREIEELKELLSDRRAALPAHSVRPHQIQAIEEIEDKIAEKEMELSRFK